jgi:hypothetical protein
MASQEIWKKENMFYQKTTFSSVSLQHITRFSCQLQVGVSWELFIIVSFPPKGPVGWSRWTGVSVFSNLLTS